MSGVRIHHPTARNCVVLLPDEGRKIQRFDGAGNPVWYDQTPSLHPVETHPGAPNSKPWRYKSRWVQVDDQGDAIVSLTVWQRIQQLPHNQWMFLNAVSDPPGQTLGSDAKAVPVSVQEQRALRDIAPSYVHVSVTRSRKMPYNIRSNGRG